MDGKSNRLENVRQILGLNKTEMAELMGITAHYYYGILAGNGKANLRVEHLEALLDKRSVNPAWIITGKGETFLEDSVEKTEWIAGHIIPNAPEADEDLLNYLVTSVIRESRLPVSNADLAFALCVRFGRYYIYRSPDATVENLDIPSLTASFLTLLQTVQSIVMDVFELTHEGKVVIHFEGRQYNFARLPRPAK